MSLNLNEGLGSLPLFMKYLQKCSNYFEIGTGASTYAASKIDGIQNIYSVESDKNWIQKIAENIQDKDKVIFLFNEMGTNGNWGYPGKHATNQQKINYSDQIHALTDEQFKTIDLILIDGRFRVACCLKCFNKMNDECIIAFDDFTIRKYYHIVLDFFNIIDNDQGCTMVILKKKQNVSIPKSLIEKYELISE